jgi:hypothetical protein
VAGFRRCRPAGPRHVGRRLAFVSRARLTLVEQLQTHSLDASARDAPGGRAGCWRPVHYLRTRRRRTWRTTRHRLPPAPTAC